MVDHIITIKHVDENCGFQVSPLQIKILTGEIIKFESKGAKIRIDLSGSNYSFSETIFEVEDNSFRLIEVLSSGITNLVFDVGCYLHNPAYPLDSRKKLVIKYAGETVDTTSIKRLRNIIQDLEILEKNLGTIINQPK